VSHNIKTVGNGDMPLFLAEFRVPNASNVMACTSPKIIANSVSVVKPTKKNPLYLETKKGEPCPHTFKCSNCQGDHQADSSLCPF